MVYNDIHCFHPTNLVHLSSFLYQAVMRKPQATNKLICLAHLPCNANQARHHTDYQCVTYHEIRSSTTGSPEIISFCRAEAFPVR